MFVSDSWRAAEQLDSAHPARLAPLSPGKIEVDRANPLLPTAPQYPRESHRPVDRACSSQAHFELRAVRFYCRIYRTLASHRGLRWARINDERYNCTPQ